MAENFSLFLNEIPEENQNFVVELDKLLVGKGSKRTIKEAKRGYVATYSSPKTGKALLNYVFRKNCVKMRIYAKHVGQYEEILSDFPNEMKKDILKATPCKKLIGQECSPTCDGGYLFNLDGEEQRKCKSMAFFHTLKPENWDYIMKLINSELDA